MNFKKNTKWQNVWLIGAFTTVLILCIVSGVLTGFNALYMISSLTGVLYTICIGYEDKWAYMFGIVNVSTYGVTAYLGGLYASAVYNVIYSVPMLIYGFFMWNKIQKEHNNKVNRLGVAKIILAIDIFAILLAILFVILTFVGGTSIIYDAIVSALGAVGIYLMARKYVEQWFVWMTCNLVSLIFWLIQAINDPSQIPLCLMFVVYFMNSTYAFIKWNKKSKSSKIELQSNY